MEKKSEIKTSDKTSKSVKKNDSDFTAIMKLLGSDLASMIFYGNDQSKFPIKGDFNPNKTKEELKNIGLLWLPYVDYSIIISDDFNGNNMGSEKNILNLLTGNILGSSNDNDPTLSQKKIKDLYKFVLVKWTDMKKMLEKMSISFDINNLKSKTALDFSKSIAIMSNFFSDKDIKYDEKGDVPEFAMEVVSIIMVKGKKNQLF